MWMSQLRDPRGTYLSRLTTVYVPTAKPAVAIAECCTMLRDIARA